MASIPRPSRRSQRALYMYVTNISVATFVTGFALGFTSPALPDLRQRSILDEEQASWFASLITVGGMLGSLASSYTLDKLGRRGSLQVANVLVALSFVLLCEFEQLSVLYIARLVAGFSSGLVFAAAPAYISEISTNEMRGTLGSCTQLAVSIGIAFAFLVDTAFSCGYVVLSAVGLAAAVFAFVRLVPIYDSPRWYVATGRRQTAIAALTLLRGSSDVAESELSEEEVHNEPTTDEKSGTATVALVEMSAEVEVVAKQSRSEAGETRSTFSAILASSIGLMAVQQFTGVNAVLFYTTDIFAETKSAFAVSYGASMISIAQIVATLIAALLMERAGRKQLLQVSLLTMAVACFLLSAFYNVSRPSGEEEAETWLGPVAVFALLVYIVGYSLGCGPVPMVVMSEVFEMRHRAVACGVSTFANWFFSFVLTLYFPSMVAAFGRATVFATFGAICFAGVAFVWHYVPETRGKTLSEIQQFFLTGLK